MTHVPPWKGMSEMEETACFGMGEGIWETSVFFTPFCWEPKITLKPSLLI